MILAFGMVDSVKQMVLPNVGGHHPTHRGPEQNKRQKERGVHFSSCLTILARTSPFIFSCPCNGIYTISSPISRAFILKLYYTTTFPEFLACKEQITGLLRLCNCMIRFLIIYTYYEMTQQEIYTWRTLTNIGANELMRFPWWFSSKESTCKCRRCGFGPRVGKISWRRKWQSTPVTLSGKLHGQRSMVGYSPRSRKELDMIQHTQHVCVCVYPAFFLS